MEQVVQMPNSFIYRIGSLLSILVFGTAYMVTNNVLSVLQRGPSMAILFANEYALTLVSLLGSVIRFALNCCDLLNPDDPVEQRSTILFYLDFFVDLFKLIIYTGFFAVVMAYYGLPIHIIRDLYITVLSFTKRVHDMINYHQIMSNLQSRYPDVTPEELAACNDPTCIICREEMITSVKRLPCGHFFHFKCLKSWLERQQVCPTCRKSVLEVAKPAPTSPIYPGEQAANPNWSETNSPYPGSTRTLNRSNSNNSVNSSTRLLFTPLRRTHSTSSLPPLLIDDHHLEDSSGSEQRLKIAADLERIGRRSRSPVGALSSSRSDSAAFNIHSAGSDDQIQTTDSSCPMSPLSHVKSKIEYVEELMEEHEKILTKLRRIEREIVRERSFSRINDEKEKDNDC